MSLRGWLSGLRATLRRRRLFRESIRGGVEVGPRFQVSNNSIVWAPRRLTIGADVHVGRNCTLEFDGMIGDHVLISNNVGIVGRSDHDIRSVGVSVRKSDWVGEHPDRLSRTTVIGSDVWIGFGTVVLSGVSIGDSAVVAAGSVVVEDVPPNSIVAGNPARVRGARFTDDEYRAHWVLLAAAGVRPTSGGQAIQ